MKYVLTVFFSLEEKSLTKERHEEWEHSQKVNQVQGTLHEHTFVRTRYEPDQDLEAEPQYTYSLRYHQKVFRAGHFAQIGGGHLGGGRKGVVLGDVGVMLIWVCIDVDCVYEVLVGLGAE